MFLGSILTRTAARKFLAAAILLTAGHISTEISAFDIIMPEEINQETYIESNENNHIILKWLNASTKDGAIKIETKIYFEVSKKPENLLCVEVYKYNSLTEKKEVVGTATVSLNNKEENAWMLDDIAVEKEYQGKGYGKIIMQEIESTIKPKALGLMAVMGSAGFYKKLGFKYLSEEQEKDPSCPDGFMCKEYA